MLKLLQTIPDWEEEIEVCTYVQYPILKSLHIGDFKRHTDILHVVQKWL